MARAGASASRSASIGGPGKGAVLRAEAIEAPFAPGRGLVDDALLAKLIGVALERGGDFADLFFEYRRSSAIAMEDGRVRNVSGGIDMGVGVRVVQGEAVGYAFAESIDPEEMIRAAVEGAGGRPVVVKPHPLAPEFCGEAIAAAEAEGLRFQVSHANVHDILAQAAVTVSINSAVAMEGFLHGVPAVLFGIADFAQFARTVTEPDGFPAALQSALGQEQDFAGWLWWYFDQGCLNIESPAFEAQLLALFEAQGFPLERFAKRMR